MQYCGYIMTTFPLDVTAMRCATTDMVQDMLHDEHLMSENNACFSGLGSWSALTVTSPWTKDE